MMNNDSDDGAVLLHLSEVLLNLHDVGLLLPPSEDLHLSVNNDSDDGAVLLHLSEGLLNLLLVDLGAGSVHFPHNVGHAGLVAEKGGHVHWLGGVILREGLAFSHVTLGSLLWQKPLGAVAGSLEFSVRHVARYSSIET